MRQTSFLCPTLLTLDDVPALTRWIDSPLMRYLHGVYRDGVVGQDFDGGRDFVGRWKRISSYGLKDEAGQIAAWALLRDQR